MKHKRTLASVLSLLLTICLCVSACTANTVPSSQPSSTESSGSTGSAPSQSASSTGSLPSVPSSIPSVPSIPSAPVISTPPGVSSSTTLPTQIEKHFVMVTFVPGQGIGTSLQVIEQGSCAQPSVPAEVAGKVFSGWYLAEDGSGEPFDFSRPITENITLYGKWTARDSALTYAFAGNESAAFEWADSDASACKVGYRLTGTAAYTYVDPYLIRSKDGSTVRADVVGLQGGKAYDFLIVTSSGSSSTVENMYISAYDRSGYAHFGYTQGVGAYNDDGTLKNGALVIYVTEDNKNNVLSAAFVDGKPVDISPYMDGGKYTGIGELLNNRRYSGTGQSQIGIAKLCEVYGAVAIRILGKVTAQQKADGTSTIVGLTDYSSQGNGGSVGDNGRMARMVNAKNLTVEGIGEDACIYGWGLHFISSNAGNTHPGAGESFEVRNIRFEAYPEDAVGMEGQQEGSQLTSPVQRCWIHHNSFYPGYCANPAESDKAEGDGSCDFKRGRYYTLSYNYFVDCHKTNLVGSSDSSLQYDITFHHNYWENCGSRIPLLRNANLHFYNNYIFCDITMDTGITGSKLGLSYVSSVRANSFLFAENNYYNGCKNPVLTQSGGVVKAFGNTYYACFEDDMSIKVENREDKVSNSCKYAAGGIDYSSFDTDPTLFYYNAAEKRSDCYLTDAVTARLEVIRCAGTQKRAGTQVNTDMNQITPASGVQMQDGQLTVSFAGITAGTVQHGISFNGKGSASGLKGKNQVITFLLTGETEVSITIAATGKDVNLGELVDSSGKVWAGKFTEFSGTLPAGIYFIGSGSKDKEVTVTALSFKDGMTPQQKIDRTIATIHAIPATISLTNECKALLDQASAAYHALTDQQKAQVTNAARLAKALQDYEALQTAQVTELNQTIASLADPATATTQQALETLYQAYASAAECYYLLTPVQQAQITNFQKLTSAMETLDSMRKPYLLRSLLDALSATVTKENLEAFLEVKALYDGIPAADRQLSATQQSKYDSLLAQYQDLQSAVVVAIFTADDKTLATDAGFTVSGNYKSGVSFVYEGVTYNKPLKMESSTKVAFSAAGEITLTLRIDSPGKSIKIDGTTYTSDSQGLVCVTLQAGSHTITKGDSCNLCYVILAPNY